MSAYVNSKRIRPGIQENVAELQNEEAQRPVLGTEGRVR
jgi:hypothetical protein